MQVRRSICILVDAYSTANGLAKVFAGYGFGSIHVQSHRYLPTVLLDTFEPHDFLQSFVYDGDFERLMSDLSLTGYDIKCVVAGAETGVTLADRLSERLGLASNGTALSEARRNKHVMGETVKAAGLRTIPQLKAHALEEIVAWVTDRAFSEVVLKPLSSSGAHGFRLCRTLDELRTAFAEVYRSKDIFGTVVEDVLVQEHVVGAEVSVNTVSCHGRFVVSDVWLTRKRVGGQAKVYDLETLLDDRHPLYDLCVAYVEQVLQALGIDFGPAHTEVLVDAQGPVLIETGARFMGSTAQSLVTEAFGVNSVLLTAEAFLAPDQFAARFARPAPAMRRRANMVQMLSQQEGTLRRYGLEELASLATFHGVDLYLDSGDPVRRTIDSYSSPGLIFLSGDDNERLLHDYNIVRWMEENGRLYEVVPG